MNLRAQETIGRAAGGSWADEKVMACFMFSRVPRGEGRLKERGQNSNSVSCGVCALVWWWQVVVVDRPLPGIFTAPKHLLARPVIGSEQGYAQEDTRTGGAVAARQREGKGKHGLSRALASPSPGLDLCTPDSRARRYCLPNQVPRSGS